MKSFIVTLVILCVAITGGTIVYLNRQKASSVPAPVAESASSQTIEQLGKIVASQEEPPQTVLQRVGKPALVSVATPASTNSTPFSQAIDTLVSPRVTFQEKQAAWKHLRDAGELDQAIEALKQGAANNLSSAEYPAALGQAELQTAGVISQNGGNINEMGILGMQADQSFDAALKLDPSNWEAQFFKAAAMSHWPAELNKGDEVVQRFSSLIDQQETMTPQPEFAQTYTLLGDEYQKLGQPDKAQATWQLGLTKFPHCHPAITC